MIINKRKALTLLLLPFQCSLKKTAKVKLNKQTPSVRGRAYTQRCTYASSAHSHNKKTHTSLHHFPFPPPGCTYFSQDFVWLSSTEWDRLMNSLRRRDGCFTTTSTVDFQYARNLFFNVVCTPQKAKRKRSQSFPMLEPLQSTRALIVWRVLTAGDNRRRGSAKERQCTLLLCLPATCSG